MSKQKLKKRVKVSQGDFFKYLVDKDGKKFAQAGLARECPLNRYLSDLLNMGKDRVYVSGDEVAIEDSNGDVTFYQVPKWMQHFVSQIDSKFGSMEVTGYDCIPVLQRATRKRFTVETASSSPLNQYNDNMESEEE